MQNQKKTIMKHLRTSFLVLLTTWLGHATYGQQYLLEPAAYESNSIGLRAGIPIFKESSEVGSLSGIYSFYALVDLGNAWSFYGEIPIILAKFEDGDFSESDHGLGNIFLEARKAFNEERTSHFSFGVYLPTVGEDNDIRQALGSLSNPYRIAQSISATTIYLNYAYSSPQEKNAIFGLEVGPELMFPTYEDSDTEVWTHFGLKGGHRFNKLDLWAAFNGQFLFTESDLDTKERLFSQLGLGARLNLGKVKPGLYYGIPLNKMIREGQSGILGIKLEVGI
jgi:hypothetical protein